MSQNPEKNSPDQTKPAGFPEKTWAEGHRPKVLLAPLDWGLGHATRCIPVIRALLETGADVWLAGEGAQAELLLGEFPDLPLLPLAGYRVRYASSRRGLAWTLVRQLPRLLQRIREEQRWLQQVQREHHFDAVISDNRYGLWHTGIPCILLTHQLAIQNPSARWTEGLIRRYLYRQLRHFQSCWVPDRKEAPGLAGRLSHPTIVPSVPLIYTGPLSRFRTLPLPEKKDHLLVLLSGPEPQRSLLEEKILAEIAHYPGTATVVRGLPGNNRIIPSTGMIRICNHLQAEELNREMQEAELVIVRSGYSSIMDLQRLGKKALLVPTPGQTEQEYLAALAASEGRAPFLSQRDFRLDLALRTARDFAYQIRPETSDEEGLRSAIRKLLHQRSS